ncbi:MAG: hypothetical protein AAGG68_02755 [Bacteroidota bacterium]
MKATYTQKSQEIIFHNNTYEASDLYRYLRREDVLILLNRLPVEEYAHLKSVTFKTCEGADAYGFVYHRRPTGIVICDQSRRTTIRTISAKRGSLEEFGALNNIKWPTLAIRRYLLYHTFLHELRHTQLLENGKKRTRDKMPLEKQANEYADYWRGELYQNHFEHPDPVHNLPSEAEKERLQQYWPKAMEYLQKGMRYKNRKDDRNALLNHEQAIQKIKLYHGDLAIENEDIKKMSWNIIGPHYSLFNMDLGATDDANTYEKVVELLKEHCEIEIINEDNYFELLKVDVNEDEYRKKFRFIDFELQEAEFQLCWAKNYKTNLQMIKPEMITERHLNLFDEIKALITQILKKKHEKN